MTDTPTTEAVAALINRLKDMGRSFPNWQDGFDAAAMLEALAAELAAHKARADALADRLVKETADHDATDRRCKRLVARIQTVEAKVAKLVEALEKIAANDRRTNCRNGNINDRFHVDGPFGKIARAAIAEVQG